MRLPLQTLPTFCAVARAPSMRAAADRLHLTHSALSQQIRLLEEQTGLALFDRRGRRLALTAAGRTLLQAVEPALEQIDAGARAAAALSAEQQRVHLTVLPSFAQRWLLPRIGRWRARHPDINIELHTSQHVEDLLRGPYNAAVRQGRGPWRGLKAEKLMSSPWVVVGSPEAARRLHGRGDAALADEPLLGDTELWQRWFQAAGVSARVASVADFNDAGLMLQAVEQNIGIALTRELLAADALADGRLERLSPLELPDEVDNAYWFVYPESLADWPPLAALRGWLFDEIRLAERELSPAGTAPADR